MSRSERITLTALGLWLASGAILMIIGLLA